VYAAAEVNLVDLAREGRPMVTNRVLPKLNMDLVSVSAWRMTLPIAEDERRGREGFREALDYLARMTPDTQTLAPSGKPFGDRNIFIAEFGVPEQERGPAGSAQLERVTRGTVEEAYAWGCPWIIFWQLYDNECCSPGDDPCEPVGGPNPGAAPATKREHCRGFWLKRVDGTTSPAYDYLIRAIGPFVPPPDDVEHTVKSAGSVEVEWSQVPAADRFRLEGSEGGGPFEEVELSSPQQNAGSVMTGPHQRLRIRVRSEKDGAPPSPWFYTDLISTKHTKGK
jgi:hypothetical protein